MTSEGARVNLITAAGILDAMEMYTDTGPTHEAEAWFDLVHSQVTIQVGPSIEDFLQEALHADMIEAMKAVAAVLGATAARAGMSWGDALAEARTLLAEFLTPGD